MGFNLVPATIIRKIQNDEGSFQQFIPDAKMGWEIPREELGKAKSQLIKMWIFDYIIYNSDRHHSNFLVKDGKVYAIDNGLSFGNDFLRSDEEFYDQPMPEEVREKINNFLSWKEGAGILRDLLSDLLSTNEVEACFRRLAKVKKLLDDGEGAIKRKDATELTFN